MQIEKQGNQPDSSMFAHVVYLAAGAIVVIIIATIILVSWRSHKKNTPPFTKHPVSLLAPTVPPPGMAGSSLEATA